jgi:acyl-CoA dehydrogenase
MAFTQTPPELGNQYTTDHALRELLTRALPADVLHEIEPSLAELGRLAGDDLCRMQLADHGNEPALMQWDAWGNRIDRIEVSPLWRVAERIAAEHGLVATAYERKHGENSRLHQFALAYLFMPSTDFYACPLAMTDGAACVLLGSGNDKLIKRAVPHLTTRNPREFWTSGQWMTESIGGSDVGLTETVARSDGNQWRLTGRKSFTSVITSQMALTLARPEGNPAGGKGLALFYIETRDAQGRPNNILVNRLKDKLGTRKVPTAELELDGTPAELVMGAADGIRNIAPLLNITRTWNSVSAAAFMRRGLALARDYARRRIAFGAPLAQKSLHVDTLAGLEAEFQGALQAVFSVVELLGRSEAGRASEQQAVLLRLLTPVVKLTTAKQAVAVLSEVIESFGGAGYVEDTGLPLLLRDAQVLPIWEGTTNVLALDTLRALPATGGIEVVQREARLLLQGVREKSLIRISALVEQALEASAAWLKHAQHAGEAELEAGARRFALTLGRTLELALLARQAQWALDNRRGSHALAAARRFSATPINLITSIDRSDSNLLLAGD